METIKDGSTANITIAEGKYLVGETGKYDFYFTLNPDAIYMAYTVPSGVCNTYTPATDAPLYNLLQLLYRVNVSPCLRSTPSSIYSAVFSVLITKPLPHTGSPTFPPATPCV